MRENYIDREEVPDTCCGDVKRLLAWKQKYKTGYGLYKTVVYNEAEKDMRKWPEVYFVKVDGDALPIILSNEMAEKILKDPDEFGCTFVYNTWMNRYR